MTEFMRQVIEGGIPFGKNHFFILLLQLDKNEVQDTLGEYIGVLAKGMQLTQDDYEKFVEGIIADDMKLAFESIKQHLF
jgi:hypothetical protein